MKVEYTRGPDGLFADERRRRVLAERLASELARAPRGRFGAGNDFVAMTAVQVRLGSAVETKLALHEAHTVIAAAPASMVGQVRGPGGVVLWLHGPDLWSLVFPYPFTGLILICIDDLDGHCMQLYDDSPQARAAIERFRLDVALALGSRRYAIEIGFLPPDPQPLPDPEPLPGLG